MDKDRIDGAIKELKGAAKIAVGKAVGKIQNAIGGANDTIRDASKPK